MKITAIKAQTKNPERVSVYVDERYAFSLNHAQLLEQKLRVGLELDEPRLAELRRVSDFGKAYERALSYVMIRPRSVRELQQYARRKQWPAQDTRAITDKLLARGYLNDRAFARSWVQSRQLTKTMSTRRLRLELKQKGVTDDNINDALAEAGYDELTALRALIAKKRKLARYVKDEQKLIQYLASQGFSFDDIKTVL